MDSHATPDCVRAKYWKLSLMGMAPGGCGTYTAGTPGRAWRTRCSMWLAEQILTRLGGLLTISAWLVSALMAWDIFVFTKYLSWSSEVAYMEGLRSFRGRETTLVATTVSSSRRSFSSSSEKQAPRLSWS